MAKSHALSRFSRGGYENTSNFACDNFHWALCPIRAEIISFRLTRYNQNQSWLGWCEFSRACYPLHFFPRLLLRDCNPVSSIPTLTNGYKFSRACHPSHVFSALAIRHMFSNAWNPLHAFPPLPLVKDFTSTYDCFLANITSVDISSTEYFLFSVTSVFT